MAALIRDAVDRSYPADADDSMDARWERALASVGGFHSGLSDVGEEHDRYLEEAYIHTAFAFDRDFADQGFEVLGV
jgi:hypothetical protein